MQVSRRSYVTRRWLELPPLYALLAAHRCLSFSTRGYALIHPCSRMQAQDNRKTIKPRRPSRQSQRVPPELQPGVKLFAARGLPTHESPIDTQQDASDSDTASEGIAPTRVGLRSRNPACT